MGNLDDTYAAHLELLSNPPPAAPLTPITQEAVTEAAASLDGTRSPLDPLSDISAGNGDEMKAYVPTMREDTVAGTAEYLTENFDMDLFQARKFSENLWGNENSQRDLGIGLADFLGPGEIFGIQEGWRQAERGINSDSTLDTAIGGGVAALSAVGAGGIGIGVKNMLKNAMSSPAAQEMLGAAVQRWNAGKSPIPVGNSIEEVTDAVPVDVPANPADIELPEISTYIKQPRKAAHQVTPTELGVVQTIASTPEEAQLAVDTIARVKSNYPVGKGKDKFVSIEITGGKFKDGVFKPKAREIGYGFTPPKGTDPKAWKTKLSNSMVSDVENIVNRAQSGDQAAIGILKEARWYRDMRVRLRSEFGGMGDIFADLIGTTSAQTDVKANFNNAIEIIRRFSRGDFDVEIAAWESRAARGESMNPTTLQQMHKAGEFPLITNAAGSLFNANSPASMKALLDTFRTIKQGSAPKTPNFTGNLIGYSNDATVDVWAGRYLRNKAGLQYIPPPAEKAVSGTHNAGSTFDDPIIGAEFGFGQEVFAQAVGKLNKRGSVQGFDPSVGEMGADDLQAIVWFMEKEKWTKNGWTTKAGEGGSLDAEAAVAGAVDPVKMDKMRTQANASFKEPPRRKTETDQAYQDRVDNAYSVHAAKSANAGAVVAEDAAPLDRRILGVSAERPGASPSNYEQAEMAAGFDDVLRDDKSVVTYKLTNTYGNFAGVNERSLDAEIITTAGFDPQPLKNRLVETAIEKDQDAVFISKVIVNPQPGQNVNPGLELYFTKTQKANFAEELSARLREKGVDGFTFVTDARQADRVNVQARAQDGGDTAGITGLRVQYIPEFNDTPTPEVMQEMEDLFDDLAVEYAEKGSISSANVVHYETEVFRRDTGTDWMSGGQTYGEFTSRTVGKGN